MNINSNGTKQTTLDLLCDIIRNEMGLDADRVIIYNQKFRIPATDGVFIVIEYKGTPHILSSRNNVTNDVSGFKEVQSVNTMEMIAIGIMSKNMEALQRKEEILMAVNSLYAQSVQEANNFHISRISPIENLSELEASAVLYRFEISLSVFAWYEKVKTAGFFDSFHGRVNTEKVSVDFEPNNN